MNSVRIHGKFSPSGSKIRQMAERVFVKVQVYGPRQVRLHQGMILTYPYPARRGYGVHGLLIGIYTLATRLEWIEEDVSQILSGDKS